jgi:hypothetical protein
VAIVAGELGQARIVAVHHLRAGFGGALRESAHARVAALRVQMHLDHAVGRGLQADSDGVKAEEHMAGHRCPPGRPKGTGAPSGGSE